MTIPKRYILVAGTFCLSILLYVDRVCISAAKEQVTADLGLSEKQMGWVLSAFALGYAVCQSPAGWMADRWGPRRLLSTIVVLWSAFTGLTAAAYNYVTLLITRFLFGAGEAGAFPGIARATFSWIPMRERGVVQGINFSGSRLGAAIAMPVIAAMVGAFGWRMSFFVLMLVGLVWSLLWYLWFRDEPADHPGISEAELQLIHSTRQPSAPAGSPDTGVTAAGMLFSRNVWLICAQYFASNFTFFFCLTWLFPHLKETYRLHAVEAGFYTSLPFLCGAIGNWVSGAIVDGLYRRGHWVLSRRVPAIAGFVLATAGITGSAYAASVDPAIAWFSLAIFGADMTLAPSWSFCIDIGRKSAGVVSGTMNMAGNIGSFATGLAFPYLQAWTGGPRPFFFVAALLNGLAIAVWLLVNPKRSIGEEKLS